MNGTTTNDAQQIEALLASEKAAPKPAAPKMVPKASAPKPVEKPTPAPVELDEHGALQEMRPTNLVLASALPKRPALPGAPDVEDDADLIAGRANLARLSADAVQAFAEQTSLERELGIAANANASAIERVATELLVSGGDYSKIMAMKLAAEKVRHLKGACELAAKRVNELLVIARRRTNERAVAVLLTPKSRAVALAWVELLRAVEEEGAVYDDLRTAGYSPPDRALYANVDVSTAGQNVAAEDLTRRQLVSVAEVVGAAPMLARGLPAR